MIGQASFDYVFGPRRARPNGAISPAAIFSVTHNTPMMRDPRFPGLRAKLGLCDYWARTDRWPDCAADGVLPYDLEAESRRLASGSG